MLGKEVIADKNLKRFFVAQPIKISSRVPAYQNLEKIVGFCDFLFKPSHIGALELCSLVTIGTQEGLVGVDVSLLLSLRQRKEGIENNF